MRIKNSDNSHFSFEEKWFLTPYFILMFLNLAFLSFNSTIIVKVYKKESELDYPLLFISLALFLDTMSITLEYFHMLLYSYNGIGIYYF